MCRRRRDATRRFHTHSFAPPYWLLAMLIFCLSLISAKKSVEIQIYGSGELQPDDHWRRVSRANSNPELQPTSNSVTKSMQDGRRTAVLREKERSVLKTSINSTLDSNSKAQSIDFLAEDEENEKIKWPLAEELAENWKRLEDSVKKTSREWILQQVNEIETESELISQSNKSKSSEREAKENFTPPRLNDDGSFDPESATFSPDKVLVDVEKRINEGPLNGPASGEVAYITEEEAKKLGHKKHHPIRPLMVSLANLPAETDSEYEVIPHTLSKSPQRVDLISRKLFVRNDTGSDFFRERRHDLSDISIKEPHHFSRDNKTVKKDLSRLSNREYRGLTDSQAEATAAKNGDTDLLLVPEAATRIPRSTPTEVTITLNDSKAERKQPALEIGSIALKHNKSMNDAMTVEDFKAHWWENGTWGNLAPPTSVEQMRSILEQHDTSNDDGSVSKTREESEKNIVPREVSVDEDYPREYLSVPVASKVRMMTDSGKGYTLENFHQPYPNVDLMYGERIIRKRSANDMTLSQWYG